MRVSFDAGEVYFGDVLEILPALKDESIQTCITSPPYWGLRDYNAPGQIGLEQTPDEYVQKLVSVFRGVRRALKKNGTLWLNLGDSYNAAGRKGQGTRQGYKQGTNRASAEKVDLNRPPDSTLKPKDLVGIPWRVAFALQADGWYLRQDIIWHKPNPMPESVKDRCTKSHEYVFLFSKNEQYYFDTKAIKEPMVRHPHAPKNKKIDKSRNDADQMDKVWGEDGMKTKRSVWTIATEPYKGSHFATFPRKLVEPCILAGSHPGDIVLDPFFGSGTTGRVSEDFNRRFVGIELNENYLPLMLRRCKNNIMDEDFMK